MPTTDTGIYRGFAAVEADVGLGPEAFLGRSTMTADFAASTVGGTIDNLEGEFSGNVGGAVTVVTAGYDAANEFATTLTGSVTVDGITYDVSGVSDGGFGGPTGEAIAGTLDGDLETGSVVVGSFFGAYFGER
jgi:hypothetical protein